MFMANSALWFFLSSGAPGPAAEPPPPLPVFPLALSEYLATALGQPAWAMAIPQRITTYPQVVFALISKQPYYTLQRSAGLVLAEYQIDVYGDDVASMEAMVETLRRALSGYSGTMNGVPVSSSRLLESVGSAEKSSSGSDRWIYRTESTWRFLYRESIPGA